MEKEDLIKALDGDEEAGKMLVDYLQKIIDEFFDKYIKKYPKIEEARKDAMSDAGSHIIEKLTKYRYIWEEKNNYDKMARHMILHYYFAGTSEKTIEKWKQ